jgi:uncharacterized membrane protein YdjX (TVP38/TMEM64 family)
VGSVAEVKERMRKFAGDGRVRLMVFFALFLGAMVCVWLWKAGIGVDELRRGWAQTQDFLRERPLWLFLALVVLPGLPVPNSALLFLAGVVWRERPVDACLIALVAMMMNLTWTYWLAAGFGRRTMERISGWLGFRIPEVRESNRLRLVLALKLTPGIPMFVQNYLCGFLRVPFRLYLLVSLACNGLIGMGFVLAGVGFGDGKLVPALAGLLLVILGALVIRWVRAWMAERKAVGGRR